MMNGFVSSGRSVLSQVADGVCLRASTALLLRGSSSLFQVGGLKKKKTILLSTVHFWTSGGSETKVG
jgi:hypothetical protein